MKPRLTIMISATVSLLLMLAPAQGESINAGGNEASRDHPFAVEAVADFDTPWAIAVLPDGRLLITEKPGQLFLVEQTGAKTEISNLPEVAASGQNGLLDIAISPEFATDSQIFVSYVAPDTAGSRLVLARGKLALSGERAVLEDLTIIWRQEPAGGGGQPGGIIAFNPEGTHLFLSVGDRMRPDSAQDRTQARGKVMRLNLDGSTPTSNPNGGESGVIGQTWTIGHRNPYGLAFAPDGRLWLHEMGPRGGDELNLIEAGQNYGWPLVSNGNEYSGAPIPDHDTRPEFAAPAVYWTPVISPAGLAFYEGAMFPQWQGSALIGGLSAQSLIRVAFGADGQPHEVERWAMGARIRDVAVASDGAVWIIEDSAPGRLLRLTPDF